MFDKILKYVRNYEPDVAKKQGKKEMAAVKKQTKRGRPAKKITPITKEKLTEVKVCQIDDHNCVAVQLTNRMICMIESLEFSMEHIKKHPQLSADTKEDIQNFINKNIVTALWTLSPAFNIMGKYPRLKTFKMALAKAKSSGSPGILVDKKHI